VSRNHIDNLMTKTYTIDRKTASGLLDVSVRTIDRYIDKGMLSIRKDGRSVWIAKEDVVDEMIKKGIPVSDDIGIPEELKTVSEDVDKQVDTIIEDIHYKQSDESEPLDLRQKHQEQEPFETAAHSEVLDKSTPFKDKLFDTVDFYKSLYEVTKQDLDEKTEALNKMTYRLGQLESQVKNMVPQLDYKKQQQLIEQTTQKYNKMLDEERNMRKDMKTVLMKEIEEKEVRLNSQTSEMGKLRKILAAEQQNKAAFAIIAFILLFLIPVMWVFLR